MVREAHASMMAQVADREAALKCTEESKDAVRPPLAASRCNSLHTQKTATNWALRSLVVTRRKASLTARVGPGLGAAQECTAMKAQRILAAEALEVLLDPIKRQEYDMGLLKSPDKNYHELLGVEREGGCATRPRHRRQQATARRGGAGVLLC
jgi:hypothetical protein